MKRVQFGKNHSYFPRKGWGIKFNQMLAECDDQLLIEEVLYEDLFKERNSDQLGKKEKDLLAEEMGPD